MLDILSYIDANIDRPLRLAAVSTEFFMDKSYLCHAFKKETGYTFRQYLYMHRLKKARDMLLTTNLTVSEISIRSGFSNIHLFERHFKKVYGDTPKIYQKRKPKVIDFL